MSRREQRPLCPSGWCGPWRDGLCVDCGHARSENPRPPALSDMTVEYRDAVVAQVWKFLTERGYTITYTGITERAER